MQLALQLPSVLAVAHALLLYSSVKKYVYYTKRRRSERSSVRLEFVAHGLGCRPRLEAKANRYASVPEKVGTIAPL
jgi:hypothetical protein